MKVIVVNVNTSESMTGVIAAGARRYASPGTQIEVLRPYFGPQAVDCAFESYLSAVGVMDRVLAYREPYDAVVLAGFGEHGRDGLQELIAAPVVEICAGMAGLEQAITAELGVPVVDGIGAAVRLAEAVVGLGLATSKVSTYAPPDTKPITGWPLSLDVR
jgi:Asp/Glu/hydantoin racemase